MRTSILGAVLALATSAAMAACASGTASSPVHVARPTSSTPSSPTSSPTPKPATHPPTHKSTHKPTRATSSATATPAHPTKVLVFMVENHSLAEMQSQMPWTFSVAQRYGYATSYHAITHPSLPNYLAIAGGSTYGVQDDNNPSSHPISGPSVFGRALATGHTAGLYAEAMPGSCVTAPAGEYAVKHNPWAYFTDERAACGKYDVPLTGFGAAVRSGTLPDAGMVIADMCHIGHDCPLSTTDAWLRGVVGPVLAGPDFTSGRLVVVITADEDDQSAGNTVLTVVASKDMPAYQVVSSPLTHYSLSRLYAEVLGFTPLNAAANAPSLSRAFHLNAG